MKKTHILILVGIALLIVSLVSYSADFSTYDSIVSSQKKQGEFVHVIAVVDKNKPVEYDPIKNPNYLTFFAKDSLGGSVKVIYKNAMPGDLMKSERLVMTGSMQGDHFECKDILLKCPSKYKDNNQQLEKELPAANAVTGKS